MPFVGSEEEFFMNTWLGGALILGCLGPFQSSFNLSYGKETALITQLNELRRDPDLGSASLLVLPHSPCIKQSVAIS